MSAVRRRKAAERKASKLLASREVRRPPVNVEDLATGEGIQVRRVSAPNDVSGMLYQEGSEVIIGVNDNHHPHRQRFTIAHELGHWALHRSKTRPLFVDERLVFFRDGRSATAVDAKEIEANAFAAALLMPESFILADMTGKELDINDDLAMRRLSARYRVSVQALTIRLVNLGLVDGLPDRD